MKCSAISVPDEGFKCPRLLKHTPEPGRYGRLIASGDYYPKPLGQFLSSQITYWESHTRCFIVYFLFYRSAGTQGPDFLPLGLRKMGPGRLPSQMPLRKMSHVPIFLETLAYTTLVTKRIAIQAGKFCKR